MELNGVANLMMMLGMAHENGEIPTDLYEKCHKELDNLERYMLAIAVEAGKVNDGLEDMVKIPFWHEVKADHKKFPTRKESRDGI